MPTPRKVVQHYAAGDAEEGEVPKVCVGGWEGRGHAEEGEVPKVCVCVGGEGCRGGGETQGEQDGVWGTVKGLAKILNHGPAPCIPPPPCRPTLASTGS